MPHPHRRFPRPISLLKLQRQQSKKNVGFVWRFKWREKVYLNRRTENSPLNLGFDPTKTKWERGTIHNFNFSLFLLLPFSIFKRKIVYSFDGHHRHRYRSQESQTNGQPTKKDAKTQTHSRTKDKWKWQRKMKTSRPKNRKKAKNNLFN